MARGDRPLGAPPPFLGERARREWTWLAEPRPGPDRSPEAPAPPPVVSAWLDRVAPVDGDPGAATALRMHGEIKLGSWRPFRADQVISAAGFLWAATAGAGLVRVKGFDRYSHGEGEMDWRLLGLVPVMRQRDADVTRSAAGRFAAELLVLRPALARTGLVRWTETGADTALATVGMGGVDHAVTLRFGGDGRLAALSLPRWGDPDGDGFREEVFGVVFEEERRIGDAVLPSRFVAGWWPDTDRWSEGAFFRCYLDDARSLGGRAPRPQDAPGGHR